MSAKVVLVIGQLHQGGAEGQLVELALGLRSSPWSPVVACLSGVTEPHAGTLRAAGVPVEIFERAGRGDPGRVLALARFLRRERPELVHSFLVGANAYAWAASRLSRVRPLIVSSRTSMTIGSRAAKAIHARVFRRAEAVVANSEFVAGFTASYYGVERASIRVIPNGVNLSRHDGASRAGAAFRAEAGGGEGSLLVGTVGRLSREKNVALFVEAAARVLREEPAARFVIVGDGPEREALEQAAREASHEGKIRLAGARSDVAAILAGLDLYVQSSDTEGLPNAVMEAMAASRPVVATRVGGTHELVAEGATGRLVPPGEAVPMAGAILELLRDGALRRAMGAAGRSRIAAGFTVERMIAATRSLYDGLAGEARAGDGGGRR